MTSPVRTARLLVLLACLLALVTAAPAVAAPAPSGAADAAAPRLITYERAGSPGVEVARSAQASRLRGAPRDFKVFIGALADTVAAGADCEAHGVLVEKVRTDGFAVGGVFECGGYQAIWARVDGTWREVSGTQDVAQCRVLRRYGVPASIAGDTCSTSRGAARPYRHA